MAMTFKGFVAEAKLKIEEISVEEAARLIADKPDVLLLDVREPGEVAQGHIPGALHVPRGLLEPKADLEFPHREPRVADGEQEIVAYCASGARSALAAATLKEMGFTQVKSMTGGFAAWQAEGLDVAH